jgi:hypothetical protein
MSFVQLIEFRTTHPEQLDQLMDRWMSATEGKRTATRAVVAADHDRPDTYVEIVEFPSYEEAMRNSQLPETNDIARRMQELCESPPVFRNLDVRREQRL